MNNKQEGIAEAVKCHRAVARTRTGGYRYCGKPATVIAVQELGDHGDQVREFGLCEAHLAEMKQSNLLSHPELVRPV